MRAGRGWSRVRGWSSSTARDYIDRLGLPRYHHEMATAEVPVYRCTVCHAVYTAGERFCPLDAGAIAPEDRHADPRVGRTIDERYFVRRLLGRGGMGSVYEADHVGLDKRVAIKFLSTNLTDRESLARFRREAKVAGKIDHQNVVRIMDVGSADADTDFIVMELIDGKDLSAILRDEGTLDVARTTSIIRKVLRGLRAIHAANIVHRDIKPANVLLGTTTDDEQDDKEFVKIMDFGISKSMNNSDGLTNTGAIIGTPEYMAPEQLLGDSVDQRADLYAVGLMAFRMLTGKMPFTTDKGFERAAAANPYVEVPAIRSLRPDVPAALSDAFAKALAKEPEKRYPDAQSFLAALEGLAPSTRPVPWLVAPKPETNKQITGTEQTVHAAAAADTAIAPATSRTASARRPAVAPPEDDRTGTAPAVAPS
jgi:serine/threonine-protein kinase